MPAIIEPVGPPGDGDARPSWPRRLVWFVGLAAAGVAVTAGVAELLHALIRA